jgi:hypothetical protein
MALVLAPANVKKLAKPLDEPLTQQTLTISDRALSIVEISNKKTTCRGITIHNITLATLPIALVLIGGSISPTATNQPESPPGQTEFSKAAGEMAPHPSTDTAPIELSVNGVHYRIPRNYLTTMENWSGGPQALVTLRVNVPDLKPMTEETHACFTVAPSDRPPGCDPFEFHIEGRGMVSADEAFANVRHLFHSQKPIEGPFGYAKYEIGPETARGEYYRKSEGGRTLLYWCQIVYIHDKRDGICSPIGDRVSTGSELTFFFDLEQLADIDQIDANLRKLVEGFNIQTGAGNDTVHAKSGDTNSDQHGD